MDTIDRGIKRIKDLRDSINSRIEHDIFTSRCLVTLQGNEIDELLNLLDEYNCVLSLHKSVRKKHEKGE